MFPSVDDIKVFQLFSEIEMNLKFDIYKVYLKYCLIKYYELMILKFYFTDTFTALT